MPFLLQGKNFGCDFAEIFRQILRICLEISASSRFQILTFRYESAFGNSPLYQRALFFSLRAFRHFPGDIK